MMSSRITSLLNSRECPSATYSKWKQKGPFAEAASRVMVIGSSSLFPWIVIVIIRDCSADGLDPDNKNVHICRLFIVLVNDDGEASSTPALQSCRRNINRNLKHI